MDVISIYKCGVKNAVACMGTALTINHAKDLKRFADKVILCFDGDNAGKKATLRSIDILVNAGLNVYVVTIPNGHDPDEYVNMFGKDEWDKLMASSLYWVEFLIKDLAKSYNLDKVDEKNKFINDALGVIKKLQTQSEQELYLKMVQELTNVVMSVLKGDLNNLSDKVEIKENVVNKDKLPTTNENKYVKSVKFVLATLSSVWPATSVSPLLSAVIVLFSVKPSKFWVNGNDVAADTLTAPNIASSIVNTIVMLKSFFIWVFPPNIFM
jgi:DNA primase